MKKSDTVVFVASGPKATTVSILRFDLHKFEDDEEDIFMISIHERYAARPACYEKMTLAFFATHYVNQKPANICEIEELGEQDDESHFVREADDLVEAKSLDKSYPHIMKLHKRLGQMSRHRKPAILRVHRFNKEKEPNSYFFSRILQFFPWRNEEIFADNPENFYSDRKEHRAECKAV